MEMGWPGANAKLESINFTLQITAILADSGGKARTLGNPMIRRVNTKATQNLRNPNLGRVEYGERERGRIEYKVSILWKCLVMVGMKREIAFKI